MHSGGRGKMSESRDSCYQSELVQQLYLHKLGNCLPTEPLICGQRTTWTPKHRLDCAAAAEFYFFFFFFFFQHLYFWHSQSPLLLHAHKHTTIIFYCSPLGTNSPQAAVTVWQQAVNDLTGIFASRPNNRITLADAFRSCQRRARKGFMRAAAKPWHSRATGENKCRFKAI